MGKDLINSITATAKDEDASEFKDLGEDGGGEAKIDEMSDLKPLAKQLKGKTKEQTIKNTVKYVQKSLPRYKFSYYPQPVPEAVNKKTGDCTEIAKLTYYLLKQNKVPVRISHGIVAYSDKDFQKHDYAEAKIGQRWQPIDNGKWPYRERYGGGVW
jgi:transglutaminase-like putative cysteine protease